MSSRYNPKDIETKWQKVWDDSGLYKVTEESDLPKFVMLTEFPYPSGDGLHLGHVREYTLGDVIARHKRMTGHNVLYPMGYDAFGLPTENFAIKNKIAPQVATAQNIANFRKQFDSLGYGIDWSRAVNTTDPSYYKWTQWLFLQFFKAGLAFQDEIAISWCPKCKTGLANEEVVAGRHERCGTVVEKKQLKQWLLRITDYADRLIEGLKNVDYPSRIADQQINWIGKSKGAEIDFTVVDKDTVKIKVFTTRPDTLFGATFLVLAPEHELLQQITSPEQRDAVNAYIKETAVKTEIERQDENREKTGVPTGAYAVNPSTNERIPIWIADYVLAGYGTGAIMAVPAHDQRDFEFAKKFNLPIKHVINPVVIRDDAKRLTDFKKKRKIVAVVTNDKDEILTINWGPKMGGRLLIGGTIEGEELPETTAMREVVEETGYNDLEIIEIGPETFHYKYYAFSKQEAHETDVKFVFLKLKSDSKQDQNLDESEKNNFTVEWVTKSQADKDIVEPLHRYAFDKFILGECFHGEGVMTQSGTYDGLSSSDMREKVVKDLTEKGLAAERTNYRLRDWIFSRQHYWGEPIPIIHCEEHGAVAVPEDQLPVTLPDVDHYEPTDTGESPLAAISDWVNTTCPTCGKPAKRETDTMPNWAGSSWYYLRYYDPKNDQAFADRNKLEYWGEVDLYLGGMEHTTLHLLYSRFWHQFLHDQGLVPTPEPYKARRGQGIILAQDGSKMSKSKGNVVNPTEIIEQGYGADSLRLAIVFLAPYDQTTPWNPEGVAGTFRFLQRAWTLVQGHLEVRASGILPRPSDSQELQRAVHKAIKRVSEDLHQMNFNTAIAAQMELTNELYKLKLNVPLGSETWTKALTTFVQLSAPFAPYIAEELWQQLGQAGSVHTSEWPRWDEELLVEENMTIVVQVNGKLRGEIEIAVDAVEADVISAAQRESNVASFIQGQVIKKTIYVPKRLVNFVV